MNCQSQVSPEGDRTTTYVQSIQAAEGLATTLTNIRLRLCGVQGLMSPETQV